MSEPRPISRSRPEEGSTDPFRIVEARASVDYLLRTVQQHHVQLSAMADLKANILITVCSIVLTFGVGALRESASAPSLLVLAGFTLVALVLAITAVAPKFRSIRVDPEADLSPTFNLLFFGHFGALSQERYLREMAGLLASDERVYESLAKDIHQIGAYLRSQKYRYLRWSYVFFLCGFALAGVIEAVALVSSAVGGGTGPSIVRSID